MLEKAQQGMWPSQAPIGFLNIEGPNRKRIIVKGPELDPLVRKIFELYATGMYSIQELAKEAAKIVHVHRKSFNKLAKSSINGILNNPIFYGDFYWKGIIYNGTMIAVSNLNYQRKKATNPKKSDLSDIWRPLPDLNRCRRRERAVSWARLDEGDV